MKKAATKKTMRGREAPEVDPSFARVVEAFGKDQQVSAPTHGARFGSGGLKVNGKIFAMMSSKGGFVVKLPKKRVDELVSGGKGERFDPGHGRLMKEWVVAGPGEANWVELAKEAYRFVKGGTPASPGSGKARSGTRR